MSKVENYVTKAIAIANDDTHGYDQIHRWGKDYDCSALVITCVQSSGIPVKDKGATYTGNMYSVFKKCGFIDITSKVNLSTGAGLQRGDILLTPNKHTEIYCGNGKMVGARINEKGKATGGKTGDQTGKEIMVHAYNNHPWKYVLRYRENVGSKIVSNSNDNAIVKDIVNGKYGNGTTRKQTLSRLYGSAKAKELQNKVNAYIRNGYKF